MNKMQQLLDNVRLVQGSYADYVAEQILADNFKYINTFTGLEIPYSEAGVYDNTICIEVEGITFCIWNGDRANKTSIHSFDYDFKPFNLASEVRSKLRAGHKETRIAKLLVEKAAIEKELSALGGA